MISQVNDSVFDETIQKTQLSLVEFGAEWCAPCKRQLPVLESIAEEFPEITVAKIDVDTNPISKDKYSISGVPTTIAFFDGVEYARVVGATPRVRLIKEFDLYV